MVNLIAIIKKITQKNYQIKLIVTLENIHQIKKNTQYEIKRTKKTSDKQGKKVNGR